MRLKILTTTLLLASLPAFASDKSYKDAPAASFKHIGPTSIKADIQQGDKDYDDVLEAHFKRIGQANQDYTKWNHDKGKVATIKADIQQMEQVLAATGSPTTLNDQFVSSLRQLNQTRSFLRAVDTDRVNVTDALDQVCGRDNKCLGTKKTRDELRAALTDYNTCKQVIAENTSFNLFGDKCSSKYLDPLKETYEQIEAQSVKKAEELKTQREKLQARIDLQKKNLKALENLGAKVARQEGARDGEFVNTLLSMRLKRQGETFDQKLLLLDVDKLVADYDELGANAKSAAAMIDGIAAKASKKISETVFGSFVNQQIGRALQNACDDGLLRQCLMDPSLRVDESNRSVYKDILDGLKKESKTKSGATQQ